MKANAEIYQKASSFLNQVYQELGLPALEQRLLDVQQEIEMIGTYTHLPIELEHGARLAWRNSNRCIGRLYWKSLVLNDKRNVANTNEVFDALVTL